MSDPNSLVSRHLRQYHTLPPVIDPKKVLVIYDHGDRIQMTRCEIYEARSITKKLFHQGLKPVIISEKEYLSLIRAGQIEHDYRFNKSN